MLLTIYSIIGFSVQQHEEGTEIGHKLLENQGEKLPHRQLRACAVKEALQV